MIATLDPDRMRARTKRKRSSVGLVYLPAALLGLSCDVVPNPETVATAPLERHEVVADGHPLTVWEKAAEVGGATVLLLHGRTWSTLPDFDLQVEGEELSLMDGLNEEGLRTYGLDARGYGGTARDDSGWLTPDRAAEDVIAVLEWIRAREADRAPPVLFGWSYGSMVAQLAVQRRPDLVSGVILFGYPGDPDTVVAASEAPDAPPRNPTTAEAAASDFIIEGSISQRAINAYVAAALEADPIRVDWKDLHQWNELDPDAVTVATLLIEGVADPITDTRAHSSLFTRLGTPDRAWIVVPGGDHAAFLETPRPMFIEAVTSFTRRVATGN